MRNNYRIRDDGVAEIELTRGEITLVDEEDLPLLAGHKWYASGMDERYRYAVSGSGRKIIMHRLIMNAPRELVVDHINHAPLDNRRCNLRLATVSENTRNQRRRKGYTSEYKGTFWNKKAGKWEATIWDGHKNVYLGVFDDEAEAARAYNEAARELHGEFAKLNPV